MQTYMCVSNVTFSKSFAKSKTPNEICENIWTLPSSFRFYFVTVWTPYLKFSKYAWHYSFYFFETFFRFENTKTFRGSPCQFCLAYKMGDIITYCDKFLAYFDAHFDAYFDAHLQFTESAAHCCPTKNLL